MGSPVAVGPMWVEGGKARICREPVRELLKDIFCFILLKMLDCWLRICMGEVGESRDAFPGEGLTMSDGTENLAAGTSLSSSEAACRQRRGGELQT
jgi:hypothetical protein